MSQAQPSKLYVGRLNQRTDKRDLEELFEKYGRVMTVEMKTGGFAFVEFEDPRDAADAIKNLDGYDLEGSRISVEWSRKSGVPGSGCFVCGSASHWARDCPDAREKGMDVKSGKCFKCGELGHLAKYCGTSNSPYRPPPPSSYRSYPDRGYSSYDRRPHPNYGYDDRRPSYDPYYDRRRSRSPGYGPGGYEDRRSQPAGSYDDRRPPPRRSLSPGYRYGDAQRGRSPPGEYGRVVGGPYRR